MSPFIYDLVLWLFSIVVDLFFREIHPRSSWKIPKKGPVIFVAAPHANQVATLVLGTVHLSDANGVQFIDPLILMRVIRAEARRRVAFLIAEKSMKRRFIGAAARKAGALSVGRALDSTKPASGRIHLPDPDNDPLLVRGIGTDFTAPDFQVGGLVVLPSVNNVAANAEILQINGSKELRLKKPLSGPVAVQQMTGRREVQKEGSEAGRGTEDQISKYRNQEGTTFKVAPKVDQAKVYDAVFEKISRGGCVGIYPEGGSHDRTELLPLKGRSE